jgi:hypothetical protein
MFFRAPIFVALFVFFSYCALVYPQHWSKPPPSYPNQTAPDASNPGDGGAIGRTTQEPLKQTPTLWDNINEFYINYPYLSSFVTVSVKASLADGLAQANDYSPKFNPWRNLAFFLYGGLYQGCAQYWIYNEWFPQMFGSSTDFLTVLTKVCFDSFVITTTICLPSAYILKAIVFQYSLHEAWLRYYIDITENGLFLYYWALWMPVQSLTFSIIPEHLRILFIAIISFFWVIILSTISSKGDRQRNNKINEEEAIKEEERRNPMHNLQYSKQGVSYGTAERSGFMFIFIP